MPRARARRATTETQRHVVACGVLLVATLVMFGDVLFAGSGRILSHPDDDLARIFFYWHQFGFGELRQGNLALWNPHTYGGAPFLGGFQPGLLYPPNWLHLVLPESLATNTGIALHVFLAGVWVYLWTSHRRLHPVACVFAGLLFMFCGAHFLQLYRGHLPNLCTLSWAPLILLAIDGVLDTFAIEWVLMGMAAVGLQVLAGHVQYLMYTGIIAGTYALLRWVRSERRLRAAAALAMLYVGGASLAAIQLATGLDAVSESLRTDLRFEVARTFAFPPENLLTLVLPGFFGDMVTTPYWGRWTLSEMSLFVGTAACVLALAGAVHGEKRVRRLSIAMTLIALGLAFGSYTPAFRLLYDYVPGFRSFRGIAKFTFLASLFIAMLAAIGLDHLLSVRRPPRWLTVGTFTAAGALIAAGTALMLDCTRRGGAGWRSALGWIDFQDQAFLYFVAGRAPGSEAACVNAGGSLLVGGATFLLVGALLLGARKSPRLLYGLAIVGVVELMVHARYMRPTFDPAPLAARARALSGMIADARAEGARVLGPGNAPYVALGAGADDVWGEDPMILGRYARFIAATQGWQPDAILVSPGLRYLSPIFGMLRFRYAVRVDGEQVMLAPTHVNELPRAALFSRWKVARSADEVLAAMADPTFDPARVVLLEHDPGILPGWSDAPGSVSVTDVSTDVIEIRAETTQPAVLLITDNYSAGWKATPLEGSSAPAYTVLPADYTLRAIPLSPGTHHLRLEYRPTAFVIGKWVTLLSLVAFVAASATCYRKRRAARPGSLRPRAVP